MKVIRCPFCNGGYPGFRIDLGLVSEAWLECPKCHNRTKTITMSNMVINATECLREDSVKMCRKDIRRLARMWNGWQFVGVSDKVANRR